VLKTVYQFLDQKNIVFSRTTKAAFNPKLFAPTSQLSSTLLHPNHVKFQVVDRLGQVGQKLSILETEYEVQSQEASRSFTGF
jgi:hypothetical protein